MICLEEKLLFLEIYLLKFKLIILKTVNYIRNESYSLSSYLAK